MSSLSIPEYLNYSFQKYPFAPDPKSGRRRPWPACHKTVRKYVYEFSDTTRDQMIKKLKCCMDSGERISLTMDEWSSGSNRKFLNVNAHRTSDFECFGLARAKGSCSAPKLLKVLEDHLATFDVFLKDVVCLTTDGASIMDGIGRLIPCLHLKCQAHACNLAICDVFYNSEKKPKKSIELVVEEEPYVELDWNWLNEIENKEDEDTEVFNMIQFL